MVTGASTANCALILIDARNGVMEQTCRHAIIASLLQIPHLIVCINKMDLVNYQEDTFQSIKKDFEHFSTKLDVTDIRFIPISALNGDNVVNRSEKWYGMKAPLLYNENLYIGSDYNHIDCRFPVNSHPPKTEEYHDYRGYAGRIASGVFKPGDEIIILPSGFTSKIKTIDTLDGPVSEAFAPMSVTIQLTDDVM